MKRFFTRAALLYGVVFIGAVVLTAGIAALLINITERQREAQQYPLMLVEIGDNEIDPEVWGRNFPVHYDRFMMPRLDYGETPYGGSTPYSKLERYPAMVRLWAGYAFSIDHNEERGHYYAQIDQRETERVQVVNQPGACINCHAAEAPTTISRINCTSARPVPTAMIHRRWHCASRALRWWKGWRCAASISHRQPGRKCAPMSAPSVMWNITSWAKIGY